MLIDDGQCRHRELLQHNKNGRSFLQLGSSPPVEAFSKSNRPLSRHCNSFPSGQSAKKMAPGQEAVAAFLDVVSNDTMLEQWIPDEDWVRLIRDNGLKECKVQNFNMGMTSQCSWHNSRAALGGKTIVFNMKRIKTSTTAKKQIRFYCVLPAGKLAPTIPTDQCFCQSPSRHVPLTHQPFNST